MQEAPVRGAFRHVPYRADRGNHIAGIQLTSGSRNCLSGGKAFGIVSAANLPALSENVGAANTMYSAINTAASQQA